MFKALKEDPGGKSRGHEWDSGQMCLKEQRVTKQLCLHPRNNGSWEEFEFGGRGGT